MGAEKLSQFDPTTDFNIGVMATGIGGLSAKERGDGLIHQTILTLNQMPVTVGNTTGASFGSQKLYTFPQGRLGLLGILAYLGFKFPAASPDNAGSGDWSLGSTATADATLSGTDVDQIASTAMTDPAVAGVLAPTGAAKSAEAHWDGTTTALNSYLNLIIDDADVADAASDIVLVTGQVVYTWLNLGKYSLLNHV